MGDSWQCINPLTQGPTIAKVRINGNGRSYAQKLGIKKMAYKNLKELAAAAMDVDLKDVEKTRYIGNLISVYFDAEKNPPEGVIGVGAITYAQQQLIKAQESI